MEDATLDWEDHREHEFGVALAAVQIGELEKVVIVRSDMEDKTDRSFIVMVNPKIVQKSGEIITDFEGCLSILDVYGKVPRYNKVKVVAQDLDGREFRITAEGFLARAMQHEIDHTNGTVFIDHIKDQENSFYKIGDDGNLEALNYDEQVKNSSILW
jgi:peptide deformylase